MQRKNSGNSESKQIKTKAQVHKGKSQVEKFRELAREIETVDSEEPLNAAIKKVAKSPPPPKDDKKPKDD